MEQGTLGEFAGSDDGAERPAAEAAAVAGGEDDAPVVDVSERAFPDADGHLAFRVTQVDYTIEGRGDDEHPVLHVFGRVPSDEGDDEPAHARVYGFRPYFYTPVADLDLAADADAPLTEGDVVDSRLEHDRLTGLETYGDRAAEGEDIGEHGETELVVYESIRGESLVKVFGQTPRDVGQLRDRFDHYEADILFPNRLLIDKDITSGVRVPARELDDGSLKIHHTEIEPTDVEADSRVHTLDIEVDDRHGFPEDGERTIICLTAHDSYDDAYIVWLYEDESEGVAATDAVPDYEPIGDGDLDVDVRGFDDEAEMLHDYVEYVDDTDPDLLTGWNCLPADSEILHADGTQREIQDIEVGDRVLGSEGQTTAVAEVTNKWESETRIHEFELADGSSLRTSGDHRVMVGDDEQVDWKQGRSIEPGEYVLKPRTLTVETPRVPTLAELIPEERQRLDQATVEGFKEQLPHGAITELSERFDVSKETLWHTDPSVWNLDRCRTAAEEYDITIPDGGVVAKRTADPLSRELTERELYLCGLVLADGSMSESDGIRFYNTREELHEQFPGDPHLEPDGTGCYKQNVLGATLMRAFNGLGVPLGDKNAVDVDLSSIYEMPEPYIARFLAGVVDGDGNVSSSVTVAAENTTIGDWYVKLFRRLGIYAERNGATVRIPDAERDIERFRQSVLPHMSHSAKVNQVRDLSGGRSGRSENIPYALFDAEVGSDAKRIGRDKHRRGINLKRHETRSEEWEEYVFVEIEDVTVAGTEPTYDIETTTHNFFADGCLVHNCDDFDAPYLIDRIDRKAGEHDELDSDRLSRVDEVWDSGWGGPDIKGRVVFDLLYAYQRTQFSELDSYRLDAVGEEELGVGKERYPGDIGDLWSDDPERLLEYNLRDVELCVELDRKQEIIPFWEEVASFVGCKLEDATTPGDAVDMYVLHEIHGEFALPSKGRQEAEEYEGGAVFEPISGVKEMVSVLDLKCFSDDTDVATPDGVRNIEDVEVGDPVYTLDPETFECEIKPVVDTQSYENQYGELHHVAGSTHDFKVTENHRFLLSRTRGWDSLDPSDYEFDAYRDLPDAERFAFPNHEPMSGATRERFSLVDDLREGHVVVYAHEGLTSFRAAMPAGIESELDWANGTSRLAATEDKSGKYLIPVDVYRDHRSTIEDEADEVFLKYDRGHAEMPTAFEMDDWLELVGWFVTEGSFIRESPGIVLHQQDADGRESIRALLERMDLQYNAKPDCFNVSNHHLHDWFITYCGDGYAEKHLPEWVFELDSSHLRVLLETLIDGDGSRTDSGLRKFWTKSDRLKEDIVRLAVRCGEKPTVSKQSDGTWYVSIGKQGSMKKANATVEEHDGQVYCLTAKDNHVVLAGRNGRFQWVGQSLYPMAMTTINASPETKVDPDAYDGETYVAPNGTHFRKEPDGMIREMVDELLAEREEKKSLRNDHDPGTDAYETYDRQQAAVKVIMNSLYGVLGWDRFRLYDKEMGAAVTATGREVIEFTEESASELDKNVIYGDSVSADRPIVTRDPDGMVRIVPIEALFDRAEKRPDDRVFVAADGDRRIDDGSRKEFADLDGWDALSLSEEGAAEWQPIERVIRHRTDKPVVNLQHKFGESTTTRDHSYVVDDDGEYVEATPEEVDEPLRIPDLPTETRNDVIDVYEVLSGYEREYEDGRGTGGTTIKTKRVHANDEYVWFGHDHYDELDSTVKVKRYIRPGTQECASLCRLLATYVTEGSATTKETSDCRYGASIAESRRTWLAGLQDDYYRLFENTTASVIDSDSSDERTVEYRTDRGDTSVSYDDETKKLQMMNELAAVFFREFAGQTSRGKRIPSFVYHLSDDEQDLFLETLIEGDGSREFPRYSDAYAERNFDLETTSRELAAGLSMLLVQRGKKHSLKYRDAKDSYTVRTVDSYRRGRDPVLREAAHDGYVYDLSVAENDNFVDGVGGVVLHNTDSVMLELGHDVSKAEAIEQSFEIESHINDAYDEFADRLNAAAHRFEIEFEKLYRRFFQAGKKKRYAGHIVWSEGKDVDDIDITGFEYKRSDIAPITKEVQREVLEMIVTGADREEIKSYVGEVIERVQNGDVSVEEIGIPGGIGKKLDNYDTDTAQVRGAKYANLLFGTNFASGSKPKRLYIEKVHPSFFREVEAELGLEPSVDGLYGEFKREAESGEAVICFEYADQVPEAFEVDYEKMLDKTLKGPIERILEALDISWDEVESGQEQTGLGSFM